MLAYKGTPYNISEIILGRVDIAHTDDKGTSYLLTTLREGEEVYIRCGYIQNIISKTKSWHNPNHIKLNIGDVVSIRPDGQLFVMYDVQSSENVFLLTENCNFNCIMCPQPPKKELSKYYDEAIDIIRLMDKSPEVIGITGGEPALHYNDFINVIQTIRELHPETHIQILSNGSIFKSPDQVRELVEITGTQATYCIPLYSSIPSVHDSIVQKDSAFWDTINALHMLSSAGANIEIRTVVLQQNYLNLNDWAHFISMNTPYVQHVAIMGIEAIGHAKDNIEQLWVDPIDYGDGITATIKTCRRHGIPVSIFNHQLCTLPEEIWPFAAKSISQWKVRFLPVCNSCMMKNDCGGLFFSNTEKYSKSISIETLQAKGLING